MMRFLFFVFIVLLAVFQWRSWRAQALKRTAQKPKPDNKAQGQAQAMLACEQCGLHVPASDAVQGKQGVYCSAAHRQLQEP